MARSIHAVPAALLAIAAAVSACSDRKAPSEDGFRTALEPIVRDAFCRPLDVPQLVPEGADENAVFPVTVSANLSALGIRSDRAAVAMLDEAAQAGLLTRTASEVPAKLRGTGESPERQAVIAYAPTQRGAAYFRPVERKATKAMVTLSAVCAAKGEVVDVIRWSEPVDFGGRRVSQVTYLYRGVDPIPLMSAAERAQIAQPQERTVALAPESDGWRPAAR